MENTARERCFGEHMLGGRFSMGIHPIHDIQLKYFR